MISSSMPRYHTYPPHRAPVGALCEGSSMRTCRYAQSSDQSSMRREFYAALQGMLPSFILGYVCLPKLPSVLCRTPRANLHSGKLKICSCEILYPP